MAASLYARVELAFGRWGRLLVRRRWWVIGLCVLATALLWTGLLELRAEFSPDNFLRSGDDTLEVYDAFRARYGRDDRLLVGIESAEIFDLGFLEKLRDFHADVESRVPYIEDVTSLINARVTRGEADELIVEKLLENWPQNAAELAAVERRALANPLYTNAIISRDRSFTAMVIEPYVYSSLGEFGDADALSSFDSEGEEPEYLTNQETWELIDALQGVMAEYQAPDFQLHLVGVEVMGQQLQTISESDTTLYASISVVAIAFLLFAFFGRLTAAFLPLLVVVLSMVATLGVMGHLGIPFTTVSQVLPSFLIAVGICDSVHILSMVYSQLSEGRSRAEAIAASLQHSGLAVLLTSLTTAGGLMSFSIAKIAPVAELGLIAPIGVLLALAYSVTLLPALLAIVPLRPLARRRSAAPGRAVEWVLRHLGAVATRRPKTVLAVSGAIIALALWPIREVRLSHDNLAWLFEDDPIRVAIELIDRKFEGISTVEVLIDTGVENGLHEPDALRRIEASADYALSFRDPPVRVGKAVSIVDVVKEINQALHENQPEHYTLPDDRRLIAQELLLFENSGSDDLEDVTDSQFREARLTLQVPMVDGQHYVQFLTELRQGLREILEEDIGFEITGGVALGSRTFAVLLDSLARSYLVALLVITPMMVFLIGNFRIGLLCMIPNLIPVCLVLAMMGWLDIPMNISTLIIGSIVIGLAVDDTIHFMHKFNRYLEDTRDPRLAVERTLATTGKAMLITSLVLSTSFFSYTLGHFYGMVHFGILAGSAALIALLADILVAPALLIWFLERKTTGQTSTRPQTATS